MKLLQWMIFTGLFFMPLMDGAVPLLGIRVLIFNIYFVIFFPLALIILLHQPSLPWQKSVLMLVSICVLFLSWFWSLIEAPHIEIALVGAIKNTQLLIFALILGLTARKVKDVHFYMSAVMGSMVWVSLIGWVQTFLGNGALLIRKNLQVNAQHYLGNGLYGTRTVTAFSDPIMSGYFLAVGFCIACAWLFIATNNRFWRSCLVILILIPLLTSGSRGPIYASIITIFFLMLILKQTKYFLMALSVLGLILLVGNASQFSTVFSKGVFQVLIERLGFGLRDKRFDYWVSVFFMTRSFPFGVGIDNFIYVAPSYIPNSLLLLSSGGLDIVNTHAESMYFTQLIELGWLGFIAFLGLVGMSVRNCWKFFRRASKSVPDSYKVVGTGLLCAWVCAAIIMVTAYGYDNMGIAMLFWVLVGLSLSLGNIDLRLNNKALIKSKDQPGIVDARMPAGELRY